MLLGNTEKRVDDAVVALPALAWSSRSRHAAPDRLSVTSLRVRARVDPPDGGPHRPRDMYR